MYFIGVAIVSGVNLYANIIKLYSMWSLLFFNYTSTTFCFNIFLSFVKTHAPALLGLFSQQNLIFSWGLKSQYW